MSGIEDTPGSSSGHVVPRRPECRKGGCGRGGCRGTETDPVPEGPGVPTQPLPARGGDAATGQVGNPLNLPKPQSPHPSLSVRRCPGMGQGRGRQGTESLGQ